MTNPKSADRLHRKVSDTDRGVLTSRFDLKAARLANVAECDPRSLDELFCSFRDETWEGLVQAEHDVLVVCRATRDLSDVVCVLWLIETGVPVVLVDFSNRPLLDRVVEDLRATHRVAQRSITPLSSVPPGAGLPAGTVVLPTSGSSGKPKYVALDGRALVGNAAAVAAALKLDASDVGITSLVPAYSFGLSNVLAHLVSGGTVSCAGLSATSDEFWEHASSVGATSLAFVASSAATVTAALKRSKAPQSLRRIMFAGGKVGPHLLPELYETAHALGIDVHVMYGQTEAGPRISISPADLDESARGTVGFPIDGVRIRIVDEDGHRKAPGERGSIQVASPYAMSGYLTSQEFSQRGTSAAEWLDTGDLGSIDDVGRLWVAGRADEQAKVSGFRVELGSVAAAAEQIYRSPAVALASEHVLTVYLEASLAQLSEELADNLALCIGLPRRIVRVIAVNEFPMTSNGKLDRSALTKSAQIALPEG